MNRSQSIIKCVSIFLIILVVWVFVTEKLVRGFNPIILDMYLHDWLFIIFGGVLFACFLYYLRRLREESDVRRHVEDALHRSEERYELAMAGANDGLYDWDLATGCVYFSPHYKSMLGYADAELEDDLSSFKRLLHPDDLDRVMAEIADFVEQRSEKYEAEFRMRHKDGRYVDILSRAFLLEGADNKPVRVVGTHVDITERKRNEKALRESEHSVRMKLDAILSPAGNISTLELADIINIPALQSLMDRFVDMAGVPVALVDLNGNVLVGAGWNEICTRFHRVHPQTRAHCHESDISLASGIPHGEHRIYQCKNNMRDIATPIWLGQRHIASLYVGQFFFEDEEVDEGIFRDQAVQYGFNEQEYIEALRSVPRLPREKVVRAIEFFMDLANMISQLSFNRIILARSLHENIQLMDSLREREEIYSAIVNQAADGMALIDTETLKFVEFNDAACRAFGYTREEFSAIGLPELIANESVEEVRARLRDVAADGRRHFVGQRRHKDGRILDMNISVETIQLHGRCYVSAMWRDVTDQKRAEEALRISEQRFRDVSDAAGEFIWETDLQGNVTYISERVQAIMGYEPQDVVGDPLIKHMPTTYAVLMNEQIADPVARQFGFRDVEHCIIAKSGEPVWVSAAAVPMIGAGGEFVGFRGATLDITERKNHEREIVRLNRLYATLSELNKIITDARSRDELFAEVCRISAEIAGFQVVWIGLIDPETQDVVPVAKAGSRVKYVDRIYVSADESKPEGCGPTGISIREGRPCISNDYTANESSRPWHGAAIEFGLNANAAFPIRFHDKVIGAFMVYSDERNVFQEKESAVLIEAAADIGFALENIEREEMSRQAEHALRDSEAKFRSYIEHSPVAVFVVDSQGRWVDTNPAAEQLVGYDRAWIANLTIADLFHERDRERGMRDFAMLLERGDYDAEYCVVRGDGRQINVAARTIRIAPDRYLGFALDVTDRKESEQALRESEAKYRGLFENSMDAILLTGAESRIVAANPAACSMFGMSEDELCGIRRQDLIDASDPNLEMTPERRASLGRATFEQTYLRKDATRFPAETTSVMLGSGSYTFVMIHDITNRKRAEEERQKLQAQLLQSQKMEAIGQLAGGVAHDFNNLLTVILGYSEMLLVKLPKDDANRAYVSDIYDSGERAASLTRQLLAFSRKQILAPRIINVNNIVSNLEKMLRRLIGEDVILTTGLSPAINPVEVDPTQLEQVLINLAVNARDAMPQGGRLFIETGNCEFDEAYCRLHPALKPGHYVLVTMTDTGCGMSEDIKAKIFEPFFTTKQQGRGTGLGLATVFGIVRQSGGQVEVVSSPEVGSCFKIYLPALESAPSLLNGADDAVVPSGTERILLVEDEDDVRRIARLALETHGYSVLEACDGPAAIKIAENPAAQIDLLVTDIVMPKLSGRQVAEIIQGRRAGLKVLYISGYTDDAIVQHGFQTARVAFLQKPFAPVALARSVRQVLDTEN